MTTFTGFASCPKHLELLLKQELLDLGAIEAKEGLAGVHFEADAKNVMRMLMWTRLANRLYLKLDSQICANKKDLYNSISAIEWHRLCNDIPSTLTIKFNGTNDELKNSHFSSQVCKDAICDQMYEEFGKRPKMVKKDAHLMVYARLKHKQLDIYQDVTGHSLHQRGYREQNTLAPLKENLAAAILMRAKWPELSKQGYNLIDPMCGSGTLLTEGWQMACDLAPNLQMKSHALFSWKHFDSHHWTQLMIEAEGRAEAGLEAFRGQLIGVDHHKDSIALANENLERVQHNKRISFQYQTLDKFKIPPRNNLVVCNPPYGVRLQKNHLSSWQQLSTWLEQKAQGAQAAVLTPDASKGWLLGFRENHVYALMNGALPIQLRLFEINKANKLSAPKDQLFVLPASAQMLANRLKKNLSKLTPWAERNGVEAFRVYDADIPEYSFAIDKYRNHINIQEYQAPKTIAESKAKVHLEQAMLAVQSVLQPVTDKIHLKTRQKQKQNDQYNKLDIDAARFVVNEGDRKYLIDLGKYLDTGLFLDHRWLRNQIQKTAKDKSVLNLFCYTGAISVAAAVGEASEVTSVDTSKTYLKWCEENFKINQLRTKHEVLRADVMKHLTFDKTLHDIIIADPPTYSNSHSRDSDWDVQRDHVELIEACAQKLKPGGVIYFSNNFRKFKLEESLQDRFVIKNLSTKSMDLDFKGSRIHQCYLLERK